MPLWIGTMLANLHRSGTWPVFREWRQMVYNGRARECRHIIKSLAGKSSGPAAELGLSSSMASIRSDSENNTSHRPEFSDGEWGNRSSASLSRYFGWLNTDEYCSARISAISLGFVIKVLVASIRGPIPILIFEKLFAYEKKYFGFHRMLSTAFFSWAAVCE